MLTVEPGQIKPNSNEKRPMIIVLQTHNQIIWLLFARRAKLEYVPSMCSKKKQKSFRLFFVHFGWKVFQWKYAQLCKITRWTVKKRNGKYTRSKPLAIKRKDNEEKAKKKTQSDNA